MGKHRSRRSSHRRRRPRVRRRGAGELWAIADLVDAVLTAVEETAWNARAIAETAREAFSRGRDELESARTGAGEWSSHLTRQAETGVMLARMSADYRLYRVRAAFSSEEGAKKALDKLHTDNAKRFRRASAKHGGAFMKVGQMLSARSDILPKVWIEELQSLQDAAPPFSFEEARSVIESDLEAPLYELFASFEPEPIAAASIGQVHRAITKSGETVAVKVQRPGIGSRIKSDLAMLETFIASLESSLPETDYDTILAEIREAVMSEIDYRAEARTTQFVSNFFVAQQGENPGILVPHVIEELTNARVITTTFIEGTKITLALDALDVRAKAGDVEAKREIATILGRLLEAYLRQVLETGVFQADAHPGNLMVTPNNQVVVLDFGCARELPAPIRSRYLALLGATMRNDRETMSRLFDELGFVTRSGRKDTLFKFAEAMLNELRQAAFAAQVRWADSDELMRRASELLEASEDDPVIRVPGEFVMIARVFMTLGGIFTKYEPEIDFNAHIMPVVAPVLFEM